MTLPPEDVMVGAVLRAASQCFIAFGSSRGAPSRFQLRIVRVETRYFVASVFVVGLFIKSKRKAESSFFGPLTRKERSSSQPGLLVDL